MATLKVYTDDLIIAKALINRDEDITRDFFYRECYPLFKSQYADKERMKQMLNS